MESVFLCSAGSLGPVVLPCLSPELMELQRSASSQPPFPWFFETWSCYVVQFLGLNHPPALASQIATTPGMHYNSQLAQRNLCCLFGSHSFFIFCVSSAGDDPRTQMPGKCPTTEPHPSHNVSALIETQTRQASLHSYSLGILSEAVVASVFIINIIN